MFIFNLNFICFLLGIFQSIDTYRVRRRKYSIDKRINKIINGQSAYRGKEIQITNQVNMLHSFKFKL